MPEASQPVADLIVVEVADVQGVAGPPGPVGPTGLGVDAPISIIHIDTPTLVVGPPHMNALLVFSADAPQLVLPRDESQNLPVGFTCSAVYRGDLSVVLDVASESSAGAFGTPQRRASHYSEAGAPPKTFAPPFMPITVLKLDANEWLVTGHYVP